MTQFDMHLAQRLSDMSHHELAETLEDIINELYWDTDHWRTTPHGHFPSIVRILKMRALTPDSMDDTPIDFSTRFLSSF